jgi:hypothetical protein
MCHFATFDLIFCTVFKMLAEYEITFFFNYKLLE